MNERQTNILADLQKRITLISEDEFLWIISILGAHGCDDQGNTFLHLAAARGFERACREILLSGQNSEHPNGIGKTPAVLALENGHLDLALLIKSADGSAPQDYTVSPADNRTNQNRGTFDPTPSTRLMDADVDWHIPDDLREPILKSDANHEFELGEQWEVLSLKLSEKLRTANLSPLHSTLMLYLRFSELIKNIYLCNGDIDDQEIFISWVEETLNQSDAISNSANIIASEAYELRAKTHETLKSLEEDSMNLLKLLEWVNKTSESQSVINRALRVEADLEAHIDELRGVTSEALKFSDSLTSVNIEKEISSKLRSDLMNDAKEWIRENGRKTKIIDQICKIVEHDLFFDTLPADIGLLNPSRGVNITEEMFECFEKNDNIKDWGEQCEPQWTTKLWSVNKRN